MICKGYKKAIVALAHKMLRILYAMISNKTHYQDSSIDYEALSVARNAPRCSEARFHHHRVCHGVTCPSEGTDAYPANRVVTGQDLMRASGWVLPH